MARKRKRNRNMRVSFTTRRGKRVSFSAAKKNGKKHKRRRRPPKPPFVFAKGPMLERPRGVKTGELIQFEGSRKTYLVMKDGLKPVTMK